MNTPTYVSGVCKEVLLFALSPWTFLLDPLFGPLVRTNSGPKPQIVIVDTWPHRDPLHWFWRWYLVRHGFPSEIVYFPLQQCSFEESSLRLQRYFEENDLRDVVIVGISSGALTSLLYLQRHGGWDRVRHFVSIGAPFKGTNSAILLYHIKNLRALLPNSAFMWKLSQERVEHPERITCLSAFADELVPRWSSCLLGARREVIQVVGHDNVHSLSQATYDQVIRIVRTAVGQQ